MAEPIIDDSAVLIAVVLSAILYYNSCRNRHKLTRSGILRPKFSPWQHLLINGDEQSFLEVTGFDRVSFMRLEQLLFPLDDENIIRKGPGRPLSFDKCGQLGLYLLFLNSTMKTKHLCLIFGIVPSSASVYINKMMKLVAKKLSGNSAAKIKFPDQQKMAEYAAMVAVREPAVTNVIGFVDGVSIPVQCSDNEEQQNAAYNGYHHDTMCNNVLAFAPNGKVIYACINYPGSWHDSQVSASLIDVVIRKIGNYSFCVDQGFPRSGELFDKFVGPISTKRRAQLAPALRDLILQRHALYVSLRQASEWGMRALQDTFARLKSRLTSNKQKRQLIIYTILLLHNFRTEYVGLNQIALVFNQHYEQLININGYDRISRYFN